MRAVRIFMGVGRLHPTASLQFKRNTQPVRIELEAFGWQGLGLNMQALSGLSLSKVKHILNCTAWRRVREGWRK